MSALAERAEQYKIVFGLQDALNDFFEKAWDIFDFGGISDAEAHRRAMVALGIEAGVWDDWREDREYG